MPRAKLNELPEVIQQYYKNKNIVVKSAFIDPRTDDIKVTLDNGYNAKHFWTIGPVPAIAMAGSWRLYKAGSYK